MLVNVGMVIHAWGKSSLNVNLFLILLATAWMASYSCLHDSASCCLDDYLLLSP